MAQDLEKTIDLLREITRASNSNTANFDRLLASINNKFESIDDDVTSIELIKAYLVELAATIREKYSTTYSKFTDIQKTLNIIFEENNWHGFKKLSDSFNKSMSEFAQTTEEKSNILKTTEKNLSDKYDNSPETIEKAINLFKTLNYGYNNSLDSINSTLQDIINKLAKPTKNNSYDIDKEHLQLITSSIKELLDYLKTFDKKDNNLEKILSNISANETLKITQGAIDSIIKKSEEIFEKITTLAKNSDLTNLEKTADSINKKFDNIVTKDLFSKITNTTDSLVHHISEVKESLAKVTKNIETQPDTKLLDESLQNIFQKLESLSTDLAKTNSKENISDIDNKISKLITELSTVKNILSDVNEIITSKVFKAINEISFEKENYELKNHISKMLSRLPLKEDIDSLLEKNEIEKNAIESIYTKTEEIDDKLDTLSSKDDVAQIKAQADKIEEILDNLNLDEEFNNIYSKTNSIQNWLEKSNIKGYSEEILEKLDTKAEKQDILDISRNAEQIIEKLNEILTLNSDESSDTLISKVSEIIEELKNDILTTTGMHNSSVIEQLSELEKSASGIVSADEFNSFIEDLKTFVTKVLDKNDILSTNIEDIKNNQELILSKIDTINTESSNTIEDEKVSQIEQKLSTIDEYLTNIVKIDNDEIKRSLSEIKEVIENKKSNFDEIENDNNDIISKIEMYLTELKNLLDTNDNGINQNTNIQIEELENELVKFQATNENAWTQIIEKIEEYKNLLETKPDTTTSKDINLESSMSEISEIKNQIQKLGESFNSLNYQPDTTEGNISSFVSEKLTELSENLDTLTNNIENQLQLGFAYNAELIEEKTAVLLDFVKELRHANSGNIDLYERLTVTDNKLIDSKEELNLITTDVISSLNSKTDQLILDLEPIKELISNLASASSSKQGQKVKEKLGQLHDSVQGDLAEYTKYSKSTFDKLEETYQQINADLCETENHLRDFILGDIDSVIIKIDSLRSDLEESLNRISPPDAESMAEFKEFVEGINEFKAEQKELLSNVAEEIKTSIGEQMTSQHEELKSMLTVAINNEEIISAIDNLKKCFKVKIKELIKLQQEASQDDSGLDFGTNQYEQAFETSKNAKVIEEIKEDFNKFSELLKDLSGENPQIEEVLELIKGKMDNLTVVKNEIPEIIEADEVSQDSDDDSEEKANFNIDTDDNTSDKNDIDYEDDDDEEYEDDDEDILIGANNFDVLKALDLLKQDISNLHKDIEKVLPKEEQKKATSTLTSIPTLGKDNLLINLNNKIELLSKTINKDWLEEIKNYIAGDEIHSMLEEINDKINILTLTDNSEWIGEIKQALEQLNGGETGNVINSNSQIQSMLALINEKIDILAASDDYDLIEEVRDAIDRLEPIQDNNTNQLLNVINEKIDILASSDNIEDFEDIKDSLYSIEDKIDTVASTPSNAEDFKELKETLSSIETKIEEVSSANELESVKKAISKLEKNILKNFAENSDEDIYEIKDILDSIESKIDSVASSETTNNIEDIKYTLLNVDEKVDTVKKLSESDAKITSMLEALNHKIDIIANDETSSTHEDIEDVKHLIIAQMDYIEKLEKNNKTDAFKKCLKELTVEVNNLNNKDNTKQIQKTIKDMKESIMAAVVTIFEQVSFVEESEDIKDFVEEKTDEINKSLVAVTKQLKQITNANEDPDYTYSMQDIESDLAKLRLALNEIQTTEQETQASRLSYILDNISQIGASVVELQNSLTKEEVFGLKTRFDRINTDIKSLNAITNQLLVKSGESYNALNNGLEDFGKIITDQLTTKVDRVTKMLEKSNDSDKVMRQALIYMGEWIDSASESMNKISTNSEEILEIKSVMEDLKKELPEQTDILNSIEEKFDEQQERLAFFEKQINKLSSLEDRFEEQQERIDRLEMSLEKILSAVEEIDDSKVTRKIDKIDKQIAKLSTNIEKLASYVD